MRHNYIRQARSGLLPIENDTKHLPLEGLTAMNCEVKMFSSIRTTSNIMSSVTKQSDNVKSSPCR